MFKKDTIQGLSATPGRFKKNQGRTRHVEEYVPRRIH
jgi:hypothetical protein